MCSYPNYQTELQLAERAEWRERYLEHYELLDDPKMVSCRLCQNTILSKTHCIAAHLKYRHGKKCWRLMSRVVFKRVIWKMLELNQNNPRYKEIIRLLSVNENEAFGDLLTLQVSSLISGLARYGDSLLPLFCDLPGCNESIVFVTYREYLDHQKLVHDRHAHSSKQGKPQKVEIV